MGDNFPGLLGNGRIFEIPIPFVIKLVTAVSFHVLLTRTKFGSYVLAVGGNENAARYSGIKMRAAGLAACPQQETEFRLSTLGQRRRPHGPGPALAGRGPGAGGRGAVEE